MRCSATVVSIMLLILAVAAAEGQSATPRPSPEVKKWDVWAGDWVLSGTSKDSPTGAEYKVDWTIQGHWFLGGFFVEDDQVWKGNGAEVHFKEILYYDPIKKALANAGFGSDGSTWAQTVTFDNETSTEDGIVTTPDGEVLTCRNTWVFSNNRMAVTGVQECEQKGVRWTALRVKGTKSKTTH